jgi:hypothetical protein
MILAYIPSLLLRNRFSKPFTVYLVAFIIVKGRRGKVRPLTINRTAVKELKDIFQYVKEREKEKHESLSSLFCLTVPKKPLLFFERTRLLITSIREQGTAPFENFSVFISYASEDLMFVQNLRDTLQREGIWCWFAPDALRGGDFFKARIDNAIRQCDKLLVIFSRSALASPWVKYEVELARQKERKQKTAVIIPLSLDQHSHHHCCSAHNLLQRPNDPQLLSLCPRARVRACARPAWAGVARSSRS